jgi:hypothetical protein
VGLDDDDRRYEARFKWGWNAATGEATIGEVSGPGDGFPNHDEVLTPTWGRPADTRDAIGRAWWEPPSLTIECYYEPDVPDAVIAWFRNRYPSADITA